VLADQRGQDTVEYIGVLAIVAALIGVVLLAVSTLGPTIEHGAECLIAKVFGLNICASGPAYPVSASSKTVGYSGRVAIVDGGHSYVITLTKLSNGTATITIVDTGNLGVSAEVGADASLGPLGGAGADASIGGGGYGDQTSTWTFPSWALAQRYFNQISQGSSLGLAAHDAVAGSVGQFPVLGSLATGLFDRVTGASGAPSRGSLPHKYLSSTAAGGGVQGSGNAGAHVNFGPLQAGVNASLQANAGLEHLNSGPEKGDWQLVAGISGTADGDLANWLFGAQAQGAGNVTADVSVTFSPSGVPETLQVSASGDGVWGVAPPTSANLSIPGSPSEGGSKEGGSKEGGGDEPLLSIQSDYSGGSGVGSVFTGTLNLASDPRAAQDVSAILQDDPAQIGDLINQLNTKGTETVQTYSITRSNSTYGGKVSFGAGAGGSLSDGNSNATYKPPRTREDGGAWHNGP
jgi:hypothetical protein